MLAGDRVKMKLGFALLRLRSAAAIIRNLSFMMSTTAAAAPRSTIVPPPRRNGSFFPFFPRRPINLLRLQGGDYIIDSKGVNSKFGENWAPQYVCSAAGRKSNPGPGIGQINLSSPIDTKFHSREKVACIN